MTGDFRYYLNDCRVDNATYPVLQITQEQHACCLVITSKQLLV